MTTQIAQAEQQRQADELALRVHRLRENAEHLAEMLQPRGWWDSRTWAAEARADQAAHEVARVKRERQAAEAELAALRSQIDALAGVTLAG